MSGFAVVDVETTGLDAARDCIIEVGIVLLTEDGTVEETWDSLVRPTRPVTATFIHGLRDEDVADAPDFAELAPTIDELLSSRAVTAHHVRFDCAFLNAAFARCGYDWEIEEGECVCTMDLSRIYLPDGSHSLGAVAERAGLPAPTRHRALADAMTAAGLLQAYLRLEAEGTRCAHLAYSREGREIRPATWIQALAHAQARPIRGSRAVPANARDGAVSTSSWTQSGESARA